MYLILKIYRIIILTVFLEVIKILIIVKKLNVISKSPLHSSIKHCLRLLLLLLITLAYMFLYKFYVSTLALSLIAFKIDTTSYELASCTALNRSYIYLGKIFYDFVNKFKYLEIEISTYTCQTLQQIYLNYCVMTYVHLI